MSQIKNPYHTISSYIKWTYEYALGFFRFGPLVAKNGVFRSKKRFFKKKNLIFKFFQKLKKIKTKWGIFSFFERKFFYKFFRPLEVMSTFDLGSLTFFLGTDPPFWGSKNCCKSKFHIIQYLFLVSIQKTEIWPFSTFFLTPSHCSVGGWKQLVFEQKVRSESALPKKMQKPHKCIPIRLQFELSL